MSSRTHSLGWDRANAFNCLKRLLIGAAEEPIGVIDRSRSVTLKVHACGYAVGGNFVQDDDQGGQRPVAFMSTKLSASQLHWRTLEKECYAIIWTLRKFKSFIFGVPTKTQIDHSPLTYLTETAPKNSKLMRWLFAIQTYPHLSFEFKAGNNNVAADCVSRMVYENDLVHDQDSTQ